MTTDGHDFWNYCAYCGAELGIENWPPIVETTGDSDETVIHSFCDENCKAAWSGDE